MPSLHRLLLKLKSTCNSYYINTFLYGFPKDLREDLGEVLNLIPRRTNGTLSASDNHIIYLYKNIKIKFPYRIYIKDVPDDKVNGLNEQQRMILHCIYSRSNDGYVRQKHIKALLNIDYCDWAIPYVVKVCDEYVVEILEMVYDILKNQDTDCFKRFCLDNTENFLRGYFRMVSYWNCFYRDRYPRFREYIGRKLYRECFGYTRALEKKHNNKKSRRV